MNRFSRLMATLSVTAASMGGLAVITAAPAMAATQVPVHGSSSDAGATFTGTLTWQDKNSFTATIALDDVSCDEHQAYFYFSVTPGSGKAWQGKRRYNGEGCHKGVQWSGITGKDDSGITATSVVICTDVPAKADSCKPYSYENQENHVAG